MATLFPFPSCNTRVRAMSLAHWAEVLGGKGLASMVSKLETTALEKKKKMSTVDPNIEFLHSL